MFHVDIFKRSLKILYTITIISNHKIVQLFFEPDEIKTKSKQSEFI